MKYYSTLKRKEILTHAVTWISLKSVMLSDISQSPKDKYCNIPLDSQFIERSSRKVAAKEWGRGGQRV